MGYMMVYVMVGIIILSVAALSFVSYAAKKAKGIQNGYSSIHKKAGFGISTFFIVLVLISFLFIYLGYRVSPFYEMWPVDLISFIAGEIVIAVLGIIAGGCKLLMDRISPY